MITIDNKFEIDEEVYTYHRRKYKMPCPVCSGTKKIIYNNYEIPCKQCNQTGIYDSGFTVVEPVKVKIRSIRPHILKDTITIKYKLNSLDSDANINNRSESSLFRTLEEVELRCKEINQGEKGADF